MKYNNILELYIINKLIKVHPTTHTHAGTVCNINTRTYKHTHMYMHECTYINMHTHIYIHIKCAW